MICGDALGITCGTWIAFWNGSIGAFMGAVVALVVVGLSNKHQRKNAREAREIEAIAGFVAAVGKAYEVSRTIEPSTKQDLVVVLLASTARLRLASKRTAKIADTVDRWPSAIQNLVSNEQTAEGREVYLGVNVRMLISEVYQTVLTAAPKWQNGNRAGKEQCRKELQAMSVELVEKEGMAELAIRGIAVTDSSD